MRSAAVRHWRVVEQLPDLVDRQDSAVPQLLGHADLAGHVHVLQAVRRERDPVPVVPLPLAEHHPGQRVAQLDGERLDRAIKKGVQFIAGRLVLDHRVVHAEVAVDVLPDQLHLLRVDLVAPFRQFLHVRELVPEQQQAAASGLEV